MGRGKRIAAGLTGLALSQRHVSQIGTTGNLRTAKAGEKPKPKRWWLWALALHIRLARAQFKRCSKRESFYIASCDGKQSSFAVQALQAIVIHSRKAIYARGINRTESKRTKGQRVNLCSERVTLDGVSLQRQTTLLPGSRDQSLTKDAENACYQKAALVYC